MSLILTHCENDVLLPCLVLTRLNHPSLAYGRNQPPTGRTAQASENSGKTLRFLAKATEDTKVRTVRASLVVRKDGVSRQQKIALGHLSEFGEDQRKVNFPQDSARVWQFQSPPQTTSMPSPCLPAPALHPSYMNARFVLCSSAHREQTTSTRDNVFIIRFYPADDSLSVYTTYVKDIPISLGTVR